MLPARPTEGLARVGGKFQLLRRLASGGMGDVWVARNEATGAEVAIKRCREGIASDEARLRFRHEARLGAMLSHRSIVRVFDLIEEPDGTPLLVMELLRGETLEQYLAKNGALSCREAIAIALPVLSALAHAHDSGIVHRDVTPANILLAVEPDGRVIPKLVDFGIAKLPAGQVQTLDGRVLGTPRYMAPERIRASATLDGRSDCFSVGVVVVEMLTGECPFAASSPAASLAAVLEAVVDPDPRIEPRVWLELERALAKRPYERHPSATAMAEALREALGETEASLAEALRREVPLREEAEAGPAPALAGLEGHRVPRPRATLWRIGGIAAAVVAVVLLGTAIDRAAIRAQAVGTTAIVAHEAAVVPPSPSPSLSISRAPSTTAPSVQEALGIPGPSRPQEPQRRTHRTRPVATTPGF